MCSRPAAGAQRGTGAKRPASTSKPEGQAFIEPEPDKPGIKQITNPFLKTSWNVTEQGILYNRDPAKARTLAAAAGAKIPGAA